MDTSLADLLAALLEAILTTPLGLLLMLVLLVEAFLARRTTPTVHYVPMETYERGRGGTGCLPLLALILVILLVLSQMS